MLQQRQARRGRPPTTSPTMKEHPILFSAPMILALLAGTKTQTRRIINPQPTEEGQYFRWKGPLVDRSGPFSIEDCSPFGLVGDHLWVRETCRAEELPDGTNGVRYLADNHFQPIANTTEAAEQWVKLYQYGKRRGATVPPIHAPRWTSRLLLEKVAGRVEQLLDISNEDAVAEGIELIGGQRDDSPQFRNYTDLSDTEGYGYPRNSFLSLWNSLHGPDADRANPWLWVEEFKRIQP